MGMWDDLLDSLKDQTNSQLILPDALVFPAIDAEKIAAKMEIELAAKANAERELPPHDAKGFDYFEQRIVDSVLSAVRPLQDSFSSALAAYNARLAALDPLGFDARIKQAASTNRIEIQMAADQVRSEMYSNEENLRQRENEYREFKEKHGNPADPVFSMPKWIKYLIIFGLVAVEGFFNTAVMGDFLKGGFQEALIYAIGIPVTSIVFFGLLAGFSIRGWPLADGLGKITRLCAIAAATVGSLSTSLALAAVRAAAEKDEYYNEKFFEAWLSFLKLEPLLLENPVYPLTLSGLLLIAVGMGFFAIAVVDIKSLDHPIPGFVDAFKTKERAHQEYIRKTEELNGKLIQVANISSKISGAFQSLQSWQGEYQTIIINRRKMMQNFEGYIRHVEAQVNKLLADYRQINRRHRMSPAPQYFETTWKFPEYTIQSIDEDRLAAEFKDRLQVVYKNIQDIQNDLAQEIRRLPTVITSVAKVLNK